MSREQPTKRERQFLADIARAIGCALEADRIELERRRAIDRQAAPAPCVTDQKITNPPPVKRDSLP